MSSAARRRRRSLIGGALLGIAVLAAVPGAVPLFRLSPQRRYEPLGDFHLIGSTLHLSPGQRDYVGPGFARDRSFAVFLRNVEHSNPGARRFLLQVPQMEEWYRYRAAYRLAPVPVELLGSDFVPRPGERPVLLVWGTEVPGGWEVFEETDGGFLARPSSGPAATAGGGAR